MPDLFGESFFEILESDEHIESKGDYKPAHIQGHLALRNVFLNIQMEPLL
jgi:hypothetical protein